MKRAILVLILLTIAVILPPLYTRWAESERLKQIQAVKEQARTVFGDRLDMVLSDLKNKIPPTVIILYTGGTKSHLEPCGCYQEQSGGLPRRAYVVEQIRKLGFPTFLIDAGNIFDGDAEIDARRCEINMKALSEMGYSAVGLSESDLAYDDTYLSRQRAVATFPFLARRASSRDFTQPAVVETVGEHGRSVLSRATAEAATSYQQADVIVALGDP